MDERENVTVTVTVDPGLLAKIDARAKQLDLNRSQYMRRLAREDLRTEEIAAADTRQRELPIGKAA